MCNDKEIWEKYKTVSHYTSVDKALCILESKVLFASHFQALEDTQEIVEAKRHLRNAFKKKYPFEIEKKINDGINEILYRALGEKIYLLSFSKMPNTAGLDNTDGWLSMWRYYAKNDGCYIEFDTKAFYQYGDKKLDGPYAKVMDEVFYHDCDCMKKLAETVVENYNDLISEKCSEDKKKESITSFIKMVILIKHPAFQDEREIRIGICVLQNISEKSAFLPHMKWPFEPKAVKKIIVGPSDKQIELIIKLKSYLSGLKEYQHVSIDRSNIPIVMHSK